MSNAFLTVAIPAYRRHEALKSVLTSIDLGPVKSEQVHFVVLNDSGREEDNRLYRDTIEEVRKTTSLSLEYLENTSNSGYPAAFIKLLRACNSPYVMFSADDDFIDFTHAEKLFEFLKNEKPDICSTQFWRNSRLFRGAYRMRPAQPKEFSTFNGHAPGVVYRTQAMMPFVEKIATQIQKEQTIALIYPQVLFTIEVFANGGNCWFFPLSFVRDGYQFQSQIVDQAGSHYSQFLSRTKQVTAFEEYITGLPPSDAQAEMQTSARIHSVRACIYADPNITRVIRKEFGLNPKKYFLRLVPNGLKFRIKKALRFLP